MDFSSGRAVKTQYSVPAGFTALAMNDSGTLVGFVTLQNGDSQYGLWSQGTWAPLSSATQTLTTGYSDTNDVFSSTEQATATNTVLLDINDAGEAVGFSHPTCVAPVSKGHPQCRVGEIAVHTQGATPAFYGQEVPESVWNSCGNPNPPYFYLAATHVVPSGNSYGYWCGFSAVAGTAGTPQPIGQDPSRPVPFSFVTDLSNSYPDTTFPSANQVNAAGDTVFMLNETLGDGGYGGVNDIYYTPPDPSYSQFTSRSTETPPAINDSNVVLGGATPSSSGASQPVSALLWQPGMATTTSVPITLPSTIAPTYSGSKIQLDGINDAGDLVGSAQTPSGTPEAVLAVPGCTPAAARDPQAGATREPHSGIGGGGPTIPAGCPLKVFVKLVGPIANVGTRSGLSVNGLDKKDGPVNFTALTESKTESPYAGPLEAAEKCVSGCANVLITVLDPTTGKPVAGASVAAALGNLGAAKSISGRLAGHQFLCPQSTDPQVGQCGDDLTDLQTDSDGEVHLLYWAPGETAVSTSSITATARKCSNTCSAGQQEGTDTAGITIKPYTIYRHSGGTISRDEVRALIKAVEEGRLFNSQTETASEQVFEGALEWLEHLDKSIKPIAKAVLSTYGMAITGAFKVAVLLAEAHDGLKEEKLLTVALLEALDMPGIGIFDEPLIKDIPEQPSSYFRQALIHGLGNADGIGGGGGALWDLGKFLSRLYRKHSILAVQPEHVTVTVDEISSCSSSSPQCGPGFDRSDRGIRPRLCFILDFSNRIPGGDFGTNFCVSQYNPHAFVATQQRLDRNLAK